MKKNFRECTFMDYAYDYKKGREEIFKYISLRIKKDIIAFSVLFLLGMLYYLSTR